MKRFDLLKLSFLNVFSVPIKSLLTVLGFAIGVAAVLAVLTLGEAGRNRVQSEMGRLGINRIWLTEAQKGELLRGSGNYLPFENDELVYLPAFMKIAAHEEIPVTLIGCEKEYLADAELYAGRWLWPLEWHMKTPVVLIGAELAVRYGIEPGEFVSLGEMNVLVCGLIGPKEGVSTVALEESIVIPLDLLCTETGHTICEIQLSAPESYSLQTAQTLSINALKRQGISVTAQTMEVQMEAASSVLFTFINVLKWVAMICILVGGIGVMNILLVGVRERRREIGVMKSMGTTACQICALFLQEALIYGMCGGFLGILLGMGLIQAAGRAIDLAAKVNLGNCAIVLCCAVCTGVLFGVAPAFQACKLNCVDALRQE